MLYGKILGLAHHPIARLTGIVQPCIVSYAYAIPDSLLLAHTPTPTALSPSPIPSCTPSIASTPLPVFGEKESCTNIMVLELR